MFEVSLADDSFPRQRVSSGAPWERDRAGGPQATVRRLSVLAVDDDPGILALLERVLAAHEVSTAQTGREALVLLARREFDAILCDLAMPDVNGMDVYDHLRQHACGREQRMVFMTGGAFTRRAREFLQTVPGRVVLKPFTAPEIDKALAMLASTHVAPVDGGSSKCRS